MITTPAEVQPDTSVQGMIDKTPRWKAEFVTYSIAVNV